MGTHLAQGEDVAHGEMVDDEEEDVGGEGGEDEGVHGGEAGGRGGGGMARLGGWLYKSEKAKAAAIGRWAAEEGGEGAREDGDGTEDRAPPPIAVGVTANLIGQFPRRNLSSASESPSVSRSSSLRLPVTRLPCCGPPLPETRSHAPLHAQPSSTRVSCFALRAATACDALRSGVHGPRATRRTFPGAWLCIAPPWLPAWRAGAMLAFFAGELPERSIARVSPPSGSLLSSNCHMQSEFD